MGQISLAVVSDGNGNWEKICRSLVPTGTFAGQNIRGYMSKHGLPYVPGRTYKPTPFIPIGTFNILGIDVTVSLGVARRFEGLIDYQLCIKGNLVELLARIALAALVAMILAQIVARLAPLLAL